MTQKRPVPSFVVFSLLTDRKRWHDVITSPTRTGSWNTIVFSEMMASGRSRRSFMSKCTCNGKPGVERHGAQLCGRNHTDSMVGGAIGPAVIDAATSSSQNSGLPFSTDEHVDQM